MLVYLVTEIVDIASRL